MNWCPEINSLTESCDAKVQAEVQKQFSRFFFYPNICHVCHSHDYELHLKKCGNCKMIYYCSQEHQKAHWPSHKLFCKTIKTLKHIPNDKNINAKMNLILSMENIMKKKLEAYENEMIEYQKVCEVCLEKDQNLLKPCPKCPHANFCKDHEDDEKHKEFCSIYRTCFVQDYYAVVFQELPTPRMMEFTPRNSQMTEMPNSMEEYMNTYFKPQQGCKFNFPPEDVKMYISTHFTRPLTLLYAMKKIDVKPQSNGLIIHVIGAGLREEKSLIEWEILFHWLPNQIIKLKIVLIGPELSDNSPFSKGKELQLCKECVCKEKSLNVRIENNLYLNYCEGENFEIPDIIIGFNLGIIAYDSWANSISQVVKYKCPFILTAFSEREAKDDQEVMQKNFKAKTEVERNPFASLRPKRSPIGDKVFYENKFLMLYTEVDVQKEPVSNPDHQILEKLQLQ